MTRGPRSPGRDIMLYTLMFLDGAVDHPGRYFWGSQPQGA